LRKKTARIKQTVLVYLLSSEDFGKRRSVFEAGKEGGHKKTTELRSKRRKETYGDS